MVFGRTGLRHCAWQVCAVIALVGLVYLGSSATARAQVGSPRYGSIVMVAETGEVQSAVMADELRHPASLTKMMTLYMTFEALRDRRISLNQLVPVTPHAASQSPSKLGLMPGTKITVEEAILGLVTKSANDAASALGEMLGGDEARFAQSMTMRARALGMSRTTFRNASGLPDPAQVTTARDLAVLARHLIQDFPQEYHYFSVPSFRFHGRTIFNHDHLLERYPGADGLKTGYVEASGYNLTSSAVRGNTRLIGVVLGAANGGERDLHMMALLDQAYDKLGIPVAHHDRRASARLNALLVPQPSAAVIASAAAGLAARTRAPVKWAVQVGAFASEVAARQAAQAARRIVALGDPVVETVTFKRHVSWRAELAGLSQAEASAVCSQLQRRRVSCVPRRPDARQVASR